jgi:small-conductance mechanosensitive channel
MPNRASFGGPGLLISHGNAALRILLVLLGLGFSLISAGAEDAPARPALTLSAEEMDRVVQAARDAALRELAAQDASTQSPEGRVSEPATSVVEPATGGAEGDLNTIAQNELFAFSQKFVEAIAALPNLSSKVGRIVRRLSEGSSAGSRLGAPLFLTLLGVVVGALAMRLLAKWMQLRWLRTRKSLVEPWPLGTIAVLATIDVATWCLYWSVCRYVSGALFSDQDIESIVGEWLLWQGPRFLLYVTAIAILFRPKLKEARIVLLDDNDARLASQFFLVIAAVMAIRTWVLVLSADSVTAPTLAAALLLNNLLFLTTSFWAAYRSRDAIARWIGSDWTGRGLVSPFRRFAADRWILFAGSLAVLLAFGHLYGALSGRVEVSSGLTLTLRSLLLLIFVAAVLQFIARRLGAPNSSDADPTAATRVSAPLVRVIRAVIFLGTLYWLAWLWFVDSLNVVSSESWQNANSRLLQPALVIVLGLLAWTAIKFATDRYLALHMPATGAAGSVATAATASRLKTLLPLVRLAFGIALFILVALVALSGLGVNITPLLAGASVIGLAISFGSQALVKDIVSGFFFLADDAFRVGEYIQSGSYKGTVESFSLRSVRLRHHRGPVYTVPFGQLGAIENMSRDWVIEKLTIGVTHDSDVELARKLVKKIGLELAQDPEFATDTIEPLKMQGIENFGDFAIELKMKLMTKPGTQFPIKRRAYVMIKKAFAENGIKIAVPTVHVEGRDTETAAAAQQIIKRRQDAELAAAQAANQA